jgi:hypothetical protein
MNSIGPEDDRDLRARFAELRRQDVLRAPEFAGLMHRARRARRPMFTRMAAAAVCVLVAGLLVLTLHLRHPAPPAPSLTQWRSPTEFLLQTPGRDLLRSVPRFGVWPEEGIVPGPSPSPTGRKTI